jgi:hypothetical protein
MQGSRLSSRFSETLRRIRQRTVIVACNGRYQVELLILRHSSIQLTLKCVRHNRAGVDRLQAVVEIRACQPPVLIAITVAVVRQGEA